MNNLEASQCIGVKISDLQEGTKSHIHQYFQDHLMRIRTWTTETKANIHTSSLFLIIRTILSILLRSASTSVLNYMYTDICFKYTYIWYKIYIYFKLYIYRHIFNQNVIAAFISWGKLRVFPVCSGVFDFMFSLKLTEKKLSFHVQCFFFIMQSLS